MKNTFFAGCILMGSLFSSCIYSDAEVGPSGPQGPQGPGGPQGPAGESSFVFEYENLNFTAPDFDLLLTYPDDFEGLDSDIALVYFLWGTEEVDGQEAEVWRQLPQTIFTENGILQYNFDFTKHDTRLFLKGDFPLEFLTAIDTDNWVARVVIVPGDFWNSGRLSDMGYFELLEALGLEHKPAGEAIERR